MRSPAYGLLRRALPLLAYCTHARGNSDMGQSERELLAALGIDVLRLVDRTIAALVPEADRDVAVVRDLERCRRRLRTLTADLRGAS